MRRNSLTAALVFACLSLASCSSSDSVEQPKGDLSPENISDPSGPDEKLKESRLACASGLRVTGRTLRVVSTVAPITNLVGLIVGDIGPIVQGIVPEGTNSHTFEPPPSAAATLEQADIIFVNGMMLEDPIRELAKANAPKAVICELGTSSLAENDWIYDFSFPKDGGKPNPHLWTNPPYILPYLSIIRDVLLNADPANLDKYEANYVAVSRLVMNLDEAMKAGTATIPANDRKLLTYHDAYAYFALHFRYEVIGAVQPQSFEEPSPSDIAALIDQVKSKKVKAVFGSEVFPSPILEQIGKETGVRYIDVLRDDDLPGKPGDADHSWAGLMKFNYITIVEALGGDATALKAVSVDTKIPDRADYPQ
ncbi:MAG: zinc ABC transporter substrate-binding protein [Ilumatobacteraceae bacterium]|nr:zinc ABC transporter substrate-binding protein [Ilumatobacteraceae bacterium]